MKWTQVPAGDINAANQRLWVAVGDSADEVAARINTDPEFVASITQLLINGDNKSSTILEVAHEIMGRNFFGIAKAMKHFGVNPTKRQLAHLAELPFSEETLIASKNTHVLVAVFPMSIIDIRGKVERKLFYSHDKIWYNKEAFAKNKGEVGWHLVRKAPVANSTNKTWNEQRALLLKDEEAPTARIVVYAMISHLLATGGHLFGDVYVRCSDFDSAGYSVHVGEFFDRGLIIGNSWYGNRSRDVGLSAAKK